MDMRYGKFNMSGKIVLSFLTSNFLKKPLKVAKKKVKKSLLVVVF